MMWVSGKTGMYSYNIVELDNLEPRSFKMDKVQRLSRKGVH